VRGFSGNALEFDLPHRESNLAFFLAECGYDVWVSSFRGCGRHPILSDGGGWSHSIDHLAALDAPALVEGVIEITEKRPIWIGHSMGGMVLYMYLQGVTLIRSNGDLRVVPDLEPVRKRNQAILGGVAIGSPPAFHWDSNSFFGKLSHSPFYRRGLQLLNQYLLYMNEFSPMVPLGRAVSCFAARYPRAGRALALGPLSIFLYNRRNVDADAAYSLLKWAADNVSSRMAIQLLNGVLEGHFKDYHRDYDYTENMHRVTVHSFSSPGPRISPMQTPSAPSATIKSEAP
jgi:pimeloyl-ACP methyl ester carboxylesterase